MAEFITLTLYLTFAILVFLGCTYESYDQRIKVITFQNGNIRYYPQYKRGWRWKYYYDNKLHVEATRVFFTDSKVNGTAIEQCNRYMEYVRDKYLDRKVESIKYIH